MLRADLSLRATASVAAVAKETIKITFFKVFMISSLRINHCQK